MLTAEQIFDLQLWWLLNKIKKEALSSVKIRKYVVCDISKFLSENTGEYQYIPRPETQMLLFHKLEEMGAIKIREFITEINGYPHSCNITINMNEFNKLYGSIEKSCSKLLPAEDKSKDNIPTLKTTSLVAGRVIFDNEKATISFNDKLCILPPHKNEHNLCSIMFKRKINIPIEWVDIYTTITGQGEEDIDMSKEEQRVIYDAMEAANRRVKKDLHTKDNLFTWKSKSIRRNY
jgi:hypothetical protein